MKPLRKEIMNTNDQTVIGFLTETAMWLALFIVSTIIVRVTKKIWYKRESKKILKYELKKEPA